METIPVEHFTLDLKALNSTDTFLRNNCFHFEYFLFEGFKYLDLRVSNKTCLQKKNLIKPVNQLFVDHENQTYVMYHLRSLKYYTNVFLS